MHIKAAAMEKAAAFDSVSTFKPAVSTNMYVPSASPTSLEVRLYSSGASSPWRSSGRKSQKAPTARTDPMNSNNV
eukprot:CAMPEP_0185900960 /NCGR_PEP_ID=MMETSP0196C-20130402/386_1 /TAXON_ID=2932 /ORGANISM="Alexandrium fundyense, Strain CCMP1719" /LENGTH=74 /DNA_ID=CAMNT_0028619523 /DNA_START=17 /DNA_END=241 /DNA_ORIENTATION=-